MKEQDIIQLIEAYANLRDNQDWRKVQELWVKPKLDNVDKLLLVESLNSVVDSNKLYRLQGEREQLLLNDADRVVERLKAELKAIKQFNES